jgi:hypothetical protein
MAKAKQRPKTEHKIIAALKEAAETVQEAKKASPFEIAKERLIAALAEVNESLEQCHQCSDMRVFLSVTKSESEPARFRPQIYRLDYSQMTLTVRPQKMEWQVMKDPAFQDVAGKPLGR